jgi:hypothetical protein
MATIPDTLMKDIAKFFDNTQAVNSDIEADMKQYLYAIKLTVKYDDKGEDCASNNDVT